MPFPLLDKIRSLTPVGRLETFIDQFLIQLLSLIFVVITAVEFEVYYLVNSIYNPIVNFFSTKAAANSKTKMSYSGRDLIKYVQENIIYQAGVDYESKPMLVFNACHLPDPKSTDYDGLLSVILSTLDDFVENDYVVVLFSSGSQYRPGVLWLLKAYRRLTRKYKKNLKNLYIVHPAKWVKLIFDTMNKILSPKFFKKLAYVETLTDLSKLVPVHQINIPQAVIDYNRAGDPTFHRSGVLSSVPKKVAATSGQYGVPLDQLMGPKGEKGIPSAIRICVEFLEKEGIEVEGIFRRSPSSAELKVVKADLNNGIVPDFNSYNSPHHLAAVLIKMFLRELPTPIIPPEHYTQLDALPSLSPSDRSRYFQSTILPQLSLPSQILLSYIFKFLNKVSKSHTKNLMTSYNLAVVMAPNLVRGPDPIKDVGICMIAQDGSGGGVGVVTRMWVEQWDVCWKSVHDKYVRA